MQCCGTRYNTGNSRSASPVRTVRTVRDVAHICTYSTSDAPSTHVPCNPGCLNAYCIQKDSMVNGQWIRLATSCTYGGEGLSRAVEHCQYCPQASRTVRYCPQASRTVQHYPQVPGA
eukprot:365225-Chlamydomonas_euryale.AAC.2